MRCQDGALVGRRRGPDVPRAAVRSGLVTVVTVLAALGLPQPGSSQVLRGVLSERDTYVPIPLGLLTLTGAEGDTITQTLASEEGFFEFRTPGPGRYRLIAVAPGYRAVQSEILTVEGESVRIVELTMAVRPIPVEGLVIEATYEEPERPGLAGTGFYDRAATAEGEVIWPGQILASDAKFIQRLFYGSRIARVTQTRHDRPGPWNDEIWFRDLSGMALWCTPSLYIDGIWVRELLPGESIADAVPKSELLAVEMYQWPFYVPDEYQGAQACGVLLLWTKRYGGA